MQRLLYIHYKMSIILQHVRMYDTYYYNVIIATIRFISIIYIYIYIFIMRDNNMYLLLYNIEIERIKTYRSAFDK